MQARVRLSKLPCSPDKKAEKNGELRTTNDAQRANNSQNIISALKHCWESVELRETIKPFTLEIGIQQTHPTITIRRDDSKEGPPDAEVVSLLA